VSYNHVTTYAPRLHPTAGECCSPPVGGEAELHISYFLMRLRVIDELISIMEIPPNYLYDIPLFNSRELSF
jgi:hypothetical protein